MSHITEGALHAYLDGALAAIGEHVEAIEAHLASCEGCRERLDEARALRSRAAAILQQSGPAAVSQPPFDAVVARGRDHPESAGGAGHGHPRGTGWLRLAPTLRWAATIVLAVGLGWFARDVWDRNPAPPATTDLATRAEDATQPAVEVTVEDAASARQRAMSPDAARADRDDRPSIAADRIASAPGEGAAAPAPTVAQAPLRETEPAQPAPAPRASPAKAAEERVAAGAAQFKVAATPVPTMSAARLDSVVVSLDESRPSLLAANTESLAAAPAPVEQAQAAGRVQAARPAWLPTSSADAARMLGAEPFTVPDLPILATAVGTVEGWVAVRTLQELRSGVVLELVQWRPPDAVAYARQANDARAATRREEDGRARLLIERGGYVVLAHAALDSAALGALLDRLNPRP